MKIAGPEVRDLGVSDDGSPIWFSHTRELKSKQAMARLRADEGLRIHPAIKAAAQVLRR